MKLASDLRSALKPVLKASGTTAEQRFKALSSGKVTQAQLLKLLTKVR